MFATVHWCLLRPINGRSMIVMVFHGAPRIELIKLSPDTNFKGKYGSGGQSWKFESKNVTISAINSIFLQQGCDKRTFMGLKPGPRGFL